MSEQSTEKKPGKIQQLHALWADASDGELLPRAFAIEMGVAGGFNPATCRTQYQAWFKRTHSASAVGPELKGSDTAQAEPPSSAAGNTRETNTVN